MSMTGNKALALLNKWTDADWGARWRIIARGSDVGASPEQRWRGGHVPHIALGFLAGLLVLPGLVAVYAVALAQRDDGDRSPAAVADQETDVELTMCGVFPGALVGGALMWFGGLPGLAALVGAIGLAARALDRGFRAEGL